MEANAKEVSLPDDDHIALLIILHIVHLNFDVLAGPRGFYELLNLAILCDKYDVVKLIRPWYSCWLETDREQYCAPGQEEWLFIAWTFGKEAVFKDLSKHLVLTMTIDDLGRELNGEGILIGSNMPPDVGSLPRYHDLWIAMADFVIEIIFTHRMDKIRQLLNLCNHYLDRYISATKSVCRIFEEYDSWSEYHSACNAMVLGSLIRKLNDTGLWPVPEAETVKMSVTTLGEKMMKMTCHVKPAKSSNDPEHRNCSFTTGLREDVQSVLGEVKDSVSASNLEHIRAQAEKCGVEVSQLPIATNGFSFRLAR